MVDDEFFRSGFVEEAAKLSRVIFTHANLDDIAASSSRLEEILKRWTIFCSRYDSCTQLLKCALTDMRAKILPGLEICPSPRAVFSGGG